MAPVDTVRDGLAGTSNGNHEQSEVSLLARVLALRCQLLLQYNMIEGAHKLLLPIEAVQLPCTP